ncbi:MAG: TerC family protein [Bacteroidota bacterium]
MIGQFFHEIIQHPISSLLIVINIILIEAVLSIDNAAVLATMVMDLPKNQQSKALQYGIVGAYVFRTIAFLCASYLMKFWWLKFLGGIYLFFLFFNWYKQKVKQKSEDENINENKSNWIYKQLNPFFGLFISTVIMVEFMDLAFSIDNIFALAAYSTNLILLFIGSCIGILFIRFATRGFIALIAANPKMEIGAYIIIFLLAIKLLGSILVHFFPLLYFSKLIDSQYVEYFISFISLFILFISLVVKRK